MSFIQCNASVEGPNRLSGGETTATTKVVSVC